MSSGNSASVVSSHRSCSLGPPRMCWLARFKEERYSVGQVSDLERSKDPNGFFDVKKKHALPFDCDQTPLSNFATSMFILRRNLVGSCHLWMQYA